MCRRTQNNCFVASPAVAVGLLVLTREDWIQKCSWRPGSLVAVICEWVRRCGRVGGRLRARGEEQDAKLLALETCFDVDPRIVAIARIVRVGRVRELSSATGSCRL
jgi:hypothetical protein